MKFLLLLLVLPVVFMTAAISGGGGPTPTQTSVTASPSVTGGATTQETRAYGVGGTGLTSTAPCIEATSILFGLVATTHINKGCITRLYAAQCKNAACRQAMTCLDPDLLPEAKEVLGCPKDKP